MAPPHSPEEIYGYFQEVWDRSYPGELYTTDDTDCAVFAESLVKYLVASSRRESAGRVV